MTWSQPATKMPASYDEVFGYIKNTKSLRDQVTVNKGNPDRRSRKQARPTKRLIAGRFSCTA